MFCDFYQREFYVQVFFLLLYLKTLKQLLKLYYYTRVIVNTFLEIKQHYYYYVDITQKIYLIITILTVGIT